MIQDSGQRRTFASGAVRDIDEHKGRCDLMPLEEIGEVFGLDNLASFGFFLKTGDMYALSNLIIRLSESMFGNIYTAMLELSIHYSEGCQKYGPRNWEKGIPCHSFVDSTVRHMLKYGRGDTDERHDRAVLWNLFGLLWTIHNKPGYNDLPYTEKIAFHDLPYSENQKDEDFPYMGGQEEVTTHTLAECGEAIKKAADDIFKRLGL